MVLASFPEISDADLFADAPVAAPGPVAEDARAVAPKRAARRKRRAAAEIEIERQAAQCALVPEGAEHTLSEKRSAAAKARWDKNRQRDRDADAILAEPVGALAGPVGVLEDDTAANVLPIDLAPETCAAIAEHGVMFNPESETTKDYTLELQVFNKMLRLVSSSAVADAVQKDERTVRKVFRLVSALAVLHGRYRKLFSIKRVHRHLQHVGGASFRAMQFLVKEKFDIVTLRVRQDDGAKLEDSKDGNSEVVKAKLLQVTSSYHCLWKVHSRYISLRSRNPGTLASVESESAECTLAGLRSQQADLTWFKNHFELAGRISVADEHPSNGKADWALQESDPWLKLAQFICKCHKLFKTAEKLLKPFPLEKTGMIHATLTFQNPGMWGAWKRAAKRIIWRTLSYKVSRHGAGAQAAHYRDQVHALYCDVDNQKLSGAGAAKAKCRLLRKKAILNGRYENTSCVEHFCDECCEGRADACRKACCCIDDLEPPKPWNINKWLGPKDAFGFFGEWMSTHDICGRAFTEAFERPVPVDDDELPPGLVENESGDEGGDDVGNMGNAAPAPELLYALPILDADAVAVQNLDRYGEDPWRPDGKLEDPDAIESTQKRNTTYKKNALQWLRSDPISRYPALRQVHSVQQESIGEVLKQVGKGWDKRELKRRLKGGEPRFRGQMAQSGKFTEKGLIEYGSLVREESHWAIIKPEHKSHELSSATYRSASASAAITVELQESRESLYPFKPYAMIGASASARYLHACDMDEDRRKRPCIISPYWSSVLDMFPSPEEICGRELSRNGSHRVLTQLSGTQAPSIPQQKQH